MSALPPLTSRTTPERHPIVLSHYQADPLLRAHKAGDAQVRTSIDLNLTMVLADLAADGVHLPDGRSMPWEAVEEANGNPNGCFAIDDGRAEKIQTYSDYTDRAYTLFPMPGAPTMLVSGIPMHRVKGTNPYQDTLTKVRAISPISGIVLDTATGLGYTACQASRSARHVITIELDPAAHDIARQNPWSQELFDSPKITTILGDSYDVVPAFASESFDAIIHDPPTFALAGDLYSLEFYRQLHRVLRPRAKLFHYIGDPESRSSGSVTRSAAKRLQEAGFTVTPHPEAFGVVALT